MTQQHGSLGPAIKVAYDSRCKVTAIWFSTRQKVTQFGSLVQTSLNVKMQCRHPLHLLHRHHLQVQAQQRWRLVDNS